MLWDKYNIRQRGIGNPNPVKLGRCIKELERIYGIQHGATSFQGNQHNEVSPKISESPNQSDIAEMIGISVDTLNNYKKLTELISELEDLVDMGILAPTTYSLVMMRPLLKLCNGCLIFSLVDVIYLPFRELL